MDGIEPVIAYFGSMDGWKGLLVSRCASYLSRQKGWQGNEIEGCCYDVAVKLIEYTGGRVLQDEERAVDMRRKRDKELKKRSAL